MCMDFANQVLDTNDVKLVDSQGAGWSFTVISHTKDKVVQFKRNALDKRMLALAKTIYMTLTPTVTRCGVDFPLPVYIIDKALGVDFSTLIPPPMDQPFPLDRYHRGVIDLARFIARSICFPQAANEAGPWTKSASRHLDTLINDKDFSKLAPELVRIAKRTKPYLHLLDTLPLVLSHADLSALNVFVSGLSGVIDWEHASVEAFGMTLCSVYEMFLSQRVGNKIIFHGELVSEYRTVKEVLEEAFWNELWACVSDVLDPGVSGPAVRTAMIVGAFTRFMPLENLEHMRNTEEADPDNVEVLVRPRGFITALPPIVLPESGP
ncbi:hypothetical protein ANO11243_006830 [Dothideomycetidae sp. 11243]|nr:hypothetical protein ANO11243_006830 [fungal sp. No.11243]